MTRNERLENLKTLEDRYQFVHPCLVCYAHGNYFVTIEDYEDGEAKLTIEVDAETGRVTSYNNWIGYQEVDADDDQCDSIVDERIDELLTKTRR